MKLRLALLTALAGAVFLGVVGVSPAAAATVWKLGIHHNQANFAPGETEQYWLDVGNLGSSNSSGTTTLTIDLPPGITRNSVATNFDLNVFVSWNCPGAPGDSVVTCTTTEPIPRHKVSRSINLLVDVSPAATGTLTTTAEVSGGGAAQASTASEVTPISATPAGMGIDAGSFTPDFFKANEVDTERRAGSHPDVFTVPFDFNTIMGASGDPEQPKQVENIRNLEVDLPPGFIGNPTAVGECTQAEFALRTCPASSQVGREDLDIYPLGVSPGFRYWPISTAVYNLSHPRGLVADLGFIFAGNPIHIRAALDPTRNYSIVSMVSNINETLPAFNQKLTLWGFPADHSHDSERCQAFVNGDTSQECSTDAVPRPFISLPSQCEEDSSLRLHHYESWDRSGVFGPDITYDLPGKMTECDKPRFEPDVELEPTGKQAGTPTGLDVHIKVAQNENPNAVATPPVKSTVVTLPEGMALSPSFADGLDGCSEAQIALGTNEPIACPDNSRIGEVELATPLLGKALKGSMYLAKQGANPFGSLLAVYLVLRDTEERGILVKIPGRIDLDPNTGQITTSFNDLPQFPFEGLTLKFRSGTRAPLVNPPTCGTHTIGIRMTSYARPGEVVERSNSYSVNEGAGGGPCQNGPRPFSPLFSGGTQNPAAGAFSPFSMRVSRTDTDEDLAAVEATLPPGLAASLRGIPRCSEAQIAAAASRNQAGQGALEVASPSCPPASQIGTVETGTGAGPTPIYVPGKVYMAGPYKGAPLSGVAIVPAIAGPVDLGVVVARAPAYVDPVTAQVRLASDQLPRIVNGVLIKVKDLRVRLDRPGFTLNPTNCTPMEVRSHLTGGASGELAANPASHFQVANCAALPFQPRLRFKLRGGTHRGDFPALTATLRARPGDANIAATAVTLPHSEFLAQSHIRTVCTRVQFAAGQCPAASVYGQARATSPLFDKPLAGPVYLRSSSNPLPDLVARLDGEIDVVLSGRIDSFRQGIRTTFDLVPDAPVSTFTLSMQGGKKGLLENSRNLCKGKNRADVRMTGQNGKRFNSRPLVLSRCGKKGKRKGSGKHARAQRSR